MRVFILGIVIFLNSLPLQAAELSYEFELVVEHGLYTELTLWLIRDGQLRERFNNADFIVLESEEYGEFFMEIVDDSIFPGKKARGLIPFSQWLIIGIKKGDEVKKIHAMAGDIRSQNIVDISLSDDAKLGDSQRNKMPSKKVNCTKGKVIKISHKNKSKGAFVLLLSYRGKFIDQYYHSTPEEPLSVTCGSYSGDAYLYRTNF